MLCLVKFDLVVLGKKGQNMKSFHVQSCGIDTSANSLTKTSDQYHEFDIELDYP